MTASAIISYSILGVVGVLAVFGALLGLIRGVCRQMVRFVTILISIVASFIICSQLYPALISNVSGYNLAELLIGYGVNMEEAQIKLLACFDGALVGYIMALPLGVIVTPIIFCGIFFAISAVLIIIHKILCGIFGFTRKNNNALTRLFGMLVGFIQGAIVAAVFLIPVASLVDTVDGALANAEEKYPEKEATVALSSVYDEFIGDVERNPAVVAVRFGGRFIYGSFSRLEIDGEATDVTEVVDVALEIYVNYSEIAGKDLAALDENSKTSFTNIINAAVQNKYTAVVLSGFLSSLGEAFDAGAIAFEYEEPMLSLMNTLVSVLATSDKTNLSTDVTTVKNVYFLLSDSGVLVAATENPDALLDIFLDRSGGDSSLFSRLLATISENPRMQPIVTQMSSLAVSMLLQDSDIDKETAQVIEDVKVGIKDVLAIDKTAYATEEEYKTAVSDSIGITLAENGIELPEDKLDEVSEFVIEEFEGKEDITDAELAEFMAKYYDVYKDEIDELPEGADVPELG